VFLATVFLSLHTIYHSERK